MTYPSKAIARAVAAAAVLCLAGASAQAADYNFTQSFTADLSAGNSVAGVLSGSFSGIPEVSGIDAGYIANFTFTSLQFTGTYIDFSQASLPTVPVTIVIPAAAINSGGGINLFNPDPTSTGSTLGDADTGFALQGVDPISSLGITWSAGKPNSTLFSQGVPVPQGGSFIFGSIGLDQPGSPTRISIGGSSSNTYANISLAPVPEASTYLMMLAGIAGVAAAVRRRNA